MSVLPRQYIEAPTLIRRPFGLLSVMDVTDTSDQHFMGGYEYEPESCGIPTAATSLLCDPAETKTETTRAAVVVGVPLAIYSLYACRGPADYARMQSRAMQSLANGESQALAQALVLNIFQLQAVTLTGPTTTAGCLAALEQWAMDHMTERPTIHLRANAASLLDTHLEVHGNQLWTRLGSLVSVDYYPNITPAGVAGATTASWGWVTGSVIGRRGPAAVHGPSPKVPYNNEFLTLAERAYAMSVNCGSAGIAFPTDAVTATAHA